MPVAGLVWITGNSGTGKSEVCAALAGKGYRTIDSDLGTAVWVSRDTDQVIHAVDTGRQSQDRFRDHRWILIRSRVEELAGAARTQTVFVCGLVQNDEDVWDHFDVKICWVLDDTTIRKRLAQGRGNPFGKGPAEMEVVLQWSFNRQVHRSRSNLDRLVSPVGGGRSRCAGHP
jgi:hypothetical protein